MRRSRIAPTLLITILSAVTCLRAETPAPVDPTTTEKTANLLANIHRLGWSDDFLFGQEFPLSYSYPNGVNGDVENSDCKTIAGDHPGIHGADFKYFTDMPEQDAIWHTAAIKQAYENGAAITFDFHWHGKNSDYFNYAKEDNELLFNIANGDNRDGDVDWFYSDLDEILDIINNRLGVPIVFRPLHEMNGKWFWWGSRSKGGAEAYRTVYRKLVDYMKEHTDLVLFCWSPDKDLGEAYYPGDEYVDIIGFDAYSAGSVKWLSVDKQVRLLGDIVDFARERGKVAAFTETGNNENYPDGDPKWWTEKLLNPIMADERARRIAWILTWINSSWAKSPYIPTQSSPKEAIDDFREFVNHPNLLLQSEARERNLYGKPEQ